MERITFGTHSGKLWSEVPTSWLRWFCSMRNRKPEHKRLASAELGRRTNAQSGQEKQEQTRQESSQKESSQQTVKINLEVEIARWFSALAMRFHPDRGGSSDAMKALNDANASLREILRKRGVLG